MADTLFDKSSDELGAAEETITEVTSSTLENEKTLFHYTNSLDSSVDIVITGSRAGDDDFSEGIELKSESLSSGASGYYVLTEPWEQVEISITPAGGASSGSVRVYKSVDN